MRLAADVVGCGTLPSPDGALHPARPCVRDRDPPQV